MNDPRKIPSINEGLEVLHKILRVSFFVVLIQSFLGLLPYIGVNYNGGGVFGFAILGVYIYILSETYKGIKLLFINSISPVMSEQTEKAKNYLTFSIIFIVAGISYL